MLRSKKQEQRHPYHTTIFFQLYHRLKAKH